MGGRVNGRGRRDFDEFLELGAFCLDLMLMQT
jgi:hypothetical protein